MVIAAREKNDIAVGKGKRDNSLTSFFKESGQCSPFSFISPFPPSHLFLSHKSFNSYSQQLFQPSQSKSLLRPKGTRVEHGRRSSQTLHLELSQL